MSVNLTGATWVGNSSILFTGSDTLIYDITFVSNNTEYTKLTINQSSKNIVYTTSDSSIVTVYSSGSWADTSYKTIKISGGTDVKNNDLYTWLQGMGTLTLVDLFNKTKLTFTINYDLSSEEYAKLVNLVGPDFVLVPILNNVNCHTYTDIDSETSKTFYDLMSSWGSSFNGPLIKTLSGEWNYGSGVAAATNEVSYTTDAYDQYLFDVNDVAVTTTIKLALYKATVSDNVATPTGDVVDTIGFSDLVSVSCVFTEE